jgi:tripartite-type tricarboxylate transporter receptor subunit TctC
MPVSHQVPGINSIPCAGVLLLAASLVGPFSIPAHAADDFYRTKPLTLVVGYAVGGGYDVYARLLARHLPKHIPGNPTIIVQNMPGAGSLTALRHQDAIAPKDGSVVTLFDFFQIINSMFDPAKTNVDIRRLNWLGSMSEDLSVCYAWGERGIGSLAALKGRDVVHMGLTAAGSMQDIRFKVLKRMLGVNVKPVLGYAGTAAQYIAIERGELDAGCGGWSSLPAGWRTEGKIDVLVRLVPTTAANMPVGVPYAGDLVSSERDKKVLKLLSNPAQLGKPFALSREVPAERVEILRKAFDAALHDPALLAEAEKLKVDISPRSAAESEAILEEIFSMPSDVVDAAKQVIAD